MQRLSTIAVIIISLVLSPVFAFSEQAGIKNILITNNSRDLLIYFHVDGCFTPKIEEAVQSGISTTFIYKVALYHKSGDMLGAKVASREISHTIKYDPLKKDYTVTMSEKKEPFVTQDFKKAKDIMAKVEAFTATPLDLLQRETPYSLQIKAELDTIKLPLLLNYIFFFVSYWDFKTAWEAVEFTY